MEKKMYSVQIGDEIRQYEAGTTYRQIAAEHQKDYEDDIVLVFINDRLQELHKTLEGDCVMRFEIRQRSIRPFSLIWRYEETISTASRLR